MKGRGTLAIADQAIVSGSNFVAAILLVRALGLHEFGKYAIAYAFLLYVNDLQRNFIAMPMLSVAPLLSGEDKRRFADGMLAAQLIASVLVFFAFAGLGLGLRNFTHAYSVPTLLAFAACAGSFQLQDWLRRYYFLFGRGGMALLNDAVSYVGQLACFAFLWRIHALDLFSTFLVMCLTSVLAVALGPLTARFRPSLASIRTAWQRSRGMGRDLLLASQVRWLGGQGILLIGASLVGPAAIGGLRATQSLAGPVNLFLSSLDNVLPLRMGEEIQRGGAAGAYRFMQRGIALATLLFVFILLPAALFGRPLLQFFYGPALVVFYVPMLWQLLSVLVNSNSRLWVFFFRGVQDSAPIVHSNLLCAIANLASIYWLGRHFGASGVVLSGLLGQALMIVYAMLYWQRRRDALRSRYPATATLDSAKRLVLVGPDGTGKSTTLSEIQRQLPVRTIVRHWRPGLLQPLSALARSKPRTSASGAPRRDPGRFHSLRLAWYGSDFLLGGWLIDRRDMSRGTTVLYDRGALDMSVDPQRFGLQSDHGTGVLTRAVPRPDLTVLLYDSPARIIMRKPELTSPEINRQFARWRARFENGDVDAVIKVDAAPDRIARRIVSRLREADVPSPDDGAPESPLPELRILLAGTSKTERPSNSACSYIALPNLRRPRLLVPCASHSTAAKALRLYHPQRLAARLAKAAVALALRTGLPQHLLRGSHLEIAAGTAQRPALDGHLAKVLSEPAVHLGVSLGSPGPHRKPVCQVMNTRGDVLAYAKLGGNEVTRELVKHEGNVLRLLARTTVTRDSVPRVLDSGEWMGASLLLQAPPTGDGWSASGELTERHVKFLCRLHALDSRETRLSESEWRNEMKSRVQQLRDRELYYDAHLIDWAMAEAVERFDNPSLHFGFRHGDFAPWNVLQRVEKLFVLDWEYARGGSPLGFDCFHYLVHRAVLVKHASFAGFQRILSQAEEMLQRYFTHFSAPEPHIELYRALYAIDTLSWHILREIGEPSADIRRLREHWRRMLIDFNFRA